MPITRASSAVAVPVTRPSSRRTGMNSSSGSSRYAAERARPIAALGDEPQRQPHQRAERRFDGAEVDRGARQQEDAERESSRTRGPISPSRSPPLRRSRRSTPPHPPAVPLVIVAEQVQQPVQREHPQLGRLAVAGVARLALGDAAGDHDVAEESAGCGIGGLGISPESESTSVAWSLRRYWRFSARTRRVADERDADDAARPRRRDARSQAARPRRPPGRPRVVDDGHAQLRRTAPAG